MNNTISVGMGEIVVTADRDIELVCLGLGSCIAICAYDARRHVGAMVHVVLPSAQRRESIPPAKYADTAIPLLFSELRRLGSHRMDVKIALAGGAAIFSSTSEIMDIGKRNTQAVHDGLAAEKCPIAWEDVGGRESRTVTRCVATGDVRLRTVRNGEVILTRLGGVK